MLPLHTIFVVTLVSQATSALILALLAASDRRSRGLAALAVGCGLHAVAIALMPLWRDRGLLSPEAFTAALLPIIFFLFHQGLADLIRPKQRLPPIAVVLVAAVSAAAAGVAWWSALWSMQIARVAAILLIPWTARMLWNPEQRTARLRTRLTALLLGTIAATFACRLPLEPHLPASRFVLTLREFTMSEVTGLTFLLIAVYLAESQRLHTFETRRDSLTGLLNRRAMEERAKASVREAARSRRPLALLMLDLDRFKQLNDSWGHGAGDRALQAVAALLEQAATAKGSCVARLGGEEFALLLPNHTGDAARALAETIRLSISNCILLQDDFPISLTTSIGVSVWRQGENTWTAMMQRADAALYGAKRTGRNRVVLCLDTPALSAELSARDEDGRPLRQYRALPTGPSRPPSPHDSTAASTRAQEVPTEVR